MRQVIKDRIARIDTKIAECQELYKVKFKQENDPTSGKLFNASTGTKALERKIQELLDEKEQILDKAIFGSIKQSKFDRGLEDRQENLNFSLSEQREITTQLAQALADDDISEAKRLRVKLGNCNRIVAIYQNSLNSWMKKKETVVAEREREVNTLTVKERQAVHAIENP